MVIPNHSVDQKLNMKTERMIILGFKVKVLFQPTISAYMNKITVIAITLFKSIGLKLIRNTKKLLD